MIAPGENSRSASSGALSARSAGEPDSDHAARERGEISGNGQCLMSRMICATSLPAVFEMKICTFEPFETSVSV